MNTFLSNLSPVLQTLLATAFTWGMTAAGAAGVFLGKEISRKVLDGMLGFAAGVMIAASYFSLLAPAIELSAGQGIPIWMPATLGFLPVAFSFSRWIKFFPIFTRATNPPRASKAPGSAACCSCSRLPSTTSPKVWL